MIQSKAPAIFVAYDIYKEFKEGGIDSEWEIEHSIDNGRFRDVFSKQIL